MASSPRSPRSSASGSGLTSSAVARHRLGNLGNGGAGRDGRLEGRQAAASAIRSAADVPGHCRRGDGHGDDRGQAPLAVSRGIESRSDVSHRRVSRRSRPGSTELLTTRAGAATTAGEPGARGVEQHQLSRSSCGAREHQNGRAHDAVRADHGAGDTGHRPAGRVGPDQQHIGTGGSRVPTAWVTDPGPVTAGDTSNVGGSTQVMVMVVDAVCGDRSMAAGRPCRCWRADRC